MIRSAAWPCSATTSTICRKPRSARRHSVDSPHARGVSTVGVAQIVNQGLGADFRWRNVDEGRQNGKPDQVGLMLYYHRNGICRQTFGARGSWSK